MKYWSNSSLFFKTGESPLKSHLISPVPPISTNIGSPNLNLLNFVLQSSRHSEIKGQNVVLLHFQTNIFLIDFIVETQLLFENYVSSYLIRCHFIIPSQYQIKIDCLNYIKLSKITVRETQKKFYFCRIYNELSCFLIRFI